MANLIAGMPSPWTLRVCEDKNSLEIICPSTESEPYVIANVWNAGPACGQEDLQVEAMRVARLMRMADLIPELILACSDALEFQNSIRGLELPNENVKRIRHRARTSLEKAMRHYTQLTTMKDLTGK